MPERNNARMISLRLTAEEYDQLQNRHREYGAESVSEFVRMAISQLLGEDTPPSLDTRLAEIRGRMELMDGKLDTLAHVVESNAVKLAAPPNFRGVTCVNSDCGKCERCDWERGRGLVV